MTYHDHMIYNHNSYVNGFNYDTTKDMVEDNG